MVIITVYKLLKRPNNVQVVFLFIQVTFISLCKHSTLVTNFVSDIQIQQFVYLVGLHVHSKRPVRHREIDLFDQCEWFVLSSSDQH